MSISDDNSVPNAEWSSSLVSPLISDADEVFSEMSNNILKQTMDEQLEKLTHKEAEVLRLRYGFYGKEMTLEEVGKRFNVTRERIRQIEAKAIRKLQHPSKAQYLKDFI